MNRIALLLAFALVGCAPPPRPSGKPKVVASFSVLGEFVVRVAGNKVECVTLVGADGDAHTFEPTPRDAESLADAVAIFENGAHFEGWLDKLVTASGSKAKRVVATDGMALIGEGKEVDPHVWHAVPNALHMVEKVRDGLKATDPPNAAFYDENAAAYLKELRALDAWVAKEVQAVPQSDRKLVTSHDTFAYFARAYGFRVVGTAIPSVSTEAADPSTAAFAKLVDAIRTERVKSIFAEASHNPKLVERLAKEANVKLAPPLFTDALGGPGSGGDTYEAMMRHNVRTVVAALKP